MGCSDGLSEIPESLFGREWENYFIASCPMGVCLVSLKEGLKFKLNVTHISLPKVFQAQSHPLAEYGHPFQMLSCKPFKSFEI